MAIKNFEELIEKIKKTQKPKKVVVVCAGDRNTLKAVKKAEKNGIVESILIGDKNKIRKLLNEISFEKQEESIIDCESDVYAASKGVEIIKEGKADFMMKGKIQTADLLKAVVDKDKGLGRGRIMSHISILEVPTYHKILAVSDGGVVIYPTLAEKKEILENAVEVFLSLGYENPKVAVLAAIEKVNPKMKETVEAGALKKMNQDKEILNCLVEGPISYDLAISKKSVEIKEYKSPVAADADILLAPDISTGNILSKALVYSGQSKMAGFITGARVPIALTSRGASSEQKYLSLAICSAMF